MNLSEILRALSFAAHARREQVRKGSGEPYVNHLIEVAERLAWIASPRAHFVVLLCLLFLLGCSWSARLLVVNVSDKPVTVAYWLKEPPSCDSDSVRPVLATVHVKRRTSFGPLMPLDLKVGSEWRPLRANVTAACDRVSFELPPNSAARVATLRGYSQPTLDTWRELELQRLEIASAGRAMKLCGPTILVAFEGGAHHQQLLVFNGSPAQTDLDFCGAPPVPPLQRRPE
jgi:hypothetical protein